jgi:predicted dehydrogenase
MDIDIHRAASLARRYGLAYYTADADELLTDPAIDLVYIASNHASHADYAVRALAANKSVHIEKPHVVNEAQLVRLVDAVEQSRGRVSLGFNRTKSQIGRAIAEALSQAAGPAMLNWFIAGHEIPPDHWYFRPEEGGRVLGNLCHWTDFTLQLVDSTSRYPIVINPTTHTSDSDICVSYLFGDGSVAAVTFSAKGHTFEGVKEVFSGHRGDVLITMRDFDDLVIDVRERRTKLSHRYRNHGHEASIMDSYAMVRPSVGDEFNGVSARYIWETGELFLKTRDALETGRSLVIESGDRSLRSPARQPEFEGSP